uniref:Uncharacterized protein n=1 Tax=Eutreptiella gymnastica TaxID=73025 RepID=A0A7S1HW13_9EUGL
MRHSQAERSLRFYLQKPLRPRTTAAPPSSAQTSLEPCCLLLGETNPLTGRGGVSRAQKDKTVEPFRCLRTPSLPGRDWLIQQQHYCSSSSSVALLSSQTRM